MPPSASPPSPNGDSHRRAFAGALAGGLFVVQSTWLGVEATPDLVYVGNVADGWEGDVDIAVGTSGGPVKLFRNDGSDGRRSLRVELIGGAGSNPEGYGARVRVRAGGREQTAWARDGSEPRQPPSPPFSCIPRGIPVERACGPATKLTNSSLQDHRRWFIP